MKTHLQLKWRSPVNIQLMDLPAPKSSVGFHVTKSDGTRARTMAVAIGDIDLVTDMGLRPCAQIFSSGPKSFKPTLTDADKTELRRRSDKGLRIYIHGAYVDNPWGEGPSRAGSVENIVAEMRVAESIGATGVVVHLSNHTNTSLEAVLTDISARLGVENRPDIILWLEIHAAKSNPNTFETPAKLHALFARIQAMGLPLRVGLCIDTAHLFSCGTHFGAYEAAWKWLESVGEVGQIPIMIHLNDSASSLGSGVDKHASLTRGKIWADYNPTTGALPVEESGLMAVLEWASERGADVILERHEIPRGDLDLINQLGFFR